MQISSAYQNLIAYVGDDVVRFEDGVATVTKEQADLLLEHCADEFEIAVVKGAGKSEGESEVTLPDPLPDDLASLSAKQLDLLAAQREVDVSKAKNKAEKVAAITAAAAAE